MKMRLLSPLLLMLASMSVTMLAVSSAFAETVKLGFSAPLTGPQAIYGKDMQRGVMMAIEEFNSKKHKIGGKEITFALLSEDDEADARKGTQIADKLVDEKIKAMFGNLNSSVAIAASRTYYQACIPQSTTATAPEYTRQRFDSTIQLCGSSDKNTKHNTTFRMLPSDIQQGAVMGRFAADKMQFKKIAIIDDRTAYGQGLADEFEKAAKAAGAEIVQREFSSDKAVDFKPILTSLKRTKPQAIFYAGNAVQAAPLAKQMRELGIKSALMGGEMVKMDSFLKIAGPSAEGVIVSLGGRPLERMPKGVAFNELHKKRFGIPVDVYAPYAYDGAMAIFKAMEQANSVEPRDYLKFLAKVEMPAVTRNQLAYDEHGDLRNGDITIYKVTNGQWQVLDTLEN